MTYTSGVEYRNIFDRACMHIPIYIYIYKLVGTIFTIHVKFYDFIFFLCQYRNPVVDELLFSVLIDKVYINIECVVPIGLAEK